MSVTPDEARHFKSFSFRLHYCVLMVFGYIKCHIADPFDSPLRPQWAGRGGGEQREPMFYKITSLESKKKRARHLVNMMAQRRLAESDTYLTELDSATGVAVDIEWRRPHAHAHDVGDD